MGIHVAKTMREPQCFGFASLTSCHYTLMKNGARNLVLFFESWFIFSWALPDSFWHLVRRFFVFKFRIFAWYHNGRVSLQLCKFYGGSLSLKGKDAEPPVQTHVWPFKSTALAISVTILRHSLYTKISMDYILYVFISFHPFPTTYPLKGSWGRAGAYLSFFRRRWGHPGQGASSS